MMTVPNLSKQWLQAAKINYNILFLFIFLSKIALCGFFTSGYLQAMFVPFADYFVTTLSDPWQHFSSISTNVTFPYPPLMLYLLAPFVWLAKTFAGHSAYAFNVIVKAPLFMADAVIFYGLCKLRPQAKNLLLAVYAASPIVFFASYLEGQLDLIPTAFLFLSVYLLIQGRTLWSAVTMSVALLCKSTAVIALPFILIYQFRRTNIMKTFSWLTIVMSLYVVGSLPFILHTGYWQMVFNNPQQNFIFNSGLAIGNLALYPVILLLVGLVAHFSLYKKINNDLLISYLNITFVLFLIFAYPIPSWFVWITPFLSLFLVNPHQQRNEWMLLYAIFSAIYIVFFLFFYRYPLDPHVATLIFLNTPIVVATFSQNLTNIVFTLLAGMLAVKVYLNYRFSIRSNAIYKTKNQAVLIGISGDSGAGKTKFLKDLKSLLGNKKVTFLEGDGEHRWERGHSNWQQYTHLDPKANLLHQQADALMNLKNGMGVLRREYNHETGTFTQANFLRSNDYIVIAGLHPFYLPKARKLMDVKVYVDTDEALRRHWKILRDKEKRGYTKEQVLANLETRAADREKYILPQKNMADICFRYFTDSKFSLGDVDAQYDIKLQVMMSANINLEGLYNCLTSISTLQYGYDYSDDLHNQLIVFSGDITAEEVARVANTIVANKEELIDQEPIWESGLRGLRQLILLLVISHHLKEAH
jgi:uridine kinase/Gpi18-like mannosyltransferase